MDLTRNRSVLYGALIAFTGFVFLAMAAQGFAQDQLDQITPDFETIKTVKDPKHTAKIDAPDQVTAGRWFPVTITVGHRALHPTLTGHYVKSVSLYKNDVEVGRVYLSSADVIAKVTLFIALEDDATLRVLSEPTHSAAWEAKREVRVVSP